MSATHTKIMKIPGAEIGGGGGQHLQKYRRYNRGGQGTDNHNTHDVFTQKLAGTPTKCEEIKTTTVNNLNQ